MHAVGQPDPTRSHFQAMEEMERAAPGSSVRTGWLDRVSSAQGAGAAFATVGVDVEANQRALIGPAPELLISRSTTSRSPATTTRRSGPAGARRSPRCTASARADVADAGPAHARRPRHRGGAAGRGYVTANGAAYPDGDLGDALRDVARLVKADVGLRVATVDFGDWDMHDGLGRVDGGWMTRQLTELGKALAAFATDLGPDWPGHPGHADGVRPPGARRTPPAGSTTATAT